MHPERQPEDDRRSPERESSSPPDPNAPGECAAAVDAFPRGV
jgi:hypothetical protein